MLNPIESCRRQLLAEGIELCSLSASNPCDEGIVFPKLLLNQSYQDFFSHQVYHPHSKGLTQAREAISNYYLKNGVSVSPENIILTSGSSESFLYLFNLLTQPGDNILVPNPGYPLFDHIAQMNRIELKPYPLIEEKNWQIDIEALKNAKDENTKALVLVSPHNPTGSVLSASQIEELVHWGNQEKLPLICDEVFSEFYWVTEEANPLKLHNKSEIMEQTSMVTEENLIRQALDRFFAKEGTDGKFPRPLAIAQPKLCFTLNGISKMFALPALKLSWIVVSGSQDKVDEMVDALETCADTFLSCHTPVQHLLPELFKNGWSFVEQYKQEIAQRRALSLSLLSEIEGVTFNIPQGAFYCLVDVSRTRTAQKILDEEKLVIELMKQQHLYIHPGFFYDYEQGQHLMISFLTHPEKLKVGLRKLKEFLEN